MNFFSKKGWEAVGHWWFYTVMRLFGYRGARVLLVVVITVYLLCSRKIYRLVAPYLRHRFPDKDSCLARFYQTWKVVYSFGVVLVDRAWLGVREDAEFTGSFPDHQQLLSLLKEKKGLILLIAHVGPWQSAWIWLGKLPVRVHGLMQYHPQDAAKHYFDLNRRRQKPFAIIDVEGAFGGMIEAASALQRGEIVAIMGDRYIKGPAITVPFLGENVRLPASAYALALTTGAPVAVVLTAKTGLKSTEVRLYNCWRPADCPRDERQESIRRGAECFRDAVEEYLQKYPWQWYNLFDFWHQ